jgi:hypothetical protein
MIRAKFRAGKTQPGGGTMKYIFKACCLAEYHVLEGFQKVFYKLVFFKDAPPQGIHHTINWWLIHRFARLNAVILGYPIEDMEALHKKIKDTIYP